MRPSLPFLIRPSSVRLANPISAPPNPLRPAPLALLPPIPLYRRLFRAHRHKLPPEERILGDQYIKSEFRAHRNVENPVHIIGFLTEWQLYAQQLEGDNWRGEKMDAEKVEKLSDQQIGQLYELMTAIQRHEGDGEGDGEGGGEGNGEGEEGES